MNENAFTFSTFIDLFNDFITELLLQICACPAFIIIGALCAAVGVVKLAFYLMDL